MSTVKVNIGGQSVPVQVQTYQFGDQSLSASVEAGLAAVVAATADIEAASDVAVAASVSAAADAASADVDRIAAETARNEAEAIVAAVPTSASYASDSAGRTGAGTDGAQYWLRTSDGLKMRTRLTSSTSEDFLVSGQPVILLSVNGLYIRDQFIRFEVTALGANNDYTVRPFDRSVRLGGVSGTGTLPYWLWECPKTNNIGSGGVTVTVLNGDGTTFIASAFRKDLNNTPLDPGDHQLGNLLVCRRLTAAEDSGQRILWAQAPDLATKALAPLALSIDDMGVVPSAARPLHYYKAGANQHVIQMLFDEDQYVSDQDPADIIRVVEMDMATFQSDAGNCLSLNSVFTRVAGLSVQDLNMMFFDLVGGATVDTGRVPTSIGESPVIGGNYASGAGSAVISGAGHGYLVDPATSLALTLNDVTTGGVDVVSSISVTAVVGSRRYGDKLVKTLTAKCETAAHGIYCFATWEITYDPMATQQIVMRTTYDFTHASLTVTPGFVRAFAMLWAFSGLNRCQAIVNGVPQPIKTIDLRDNSDVLLGHPEAVYFWRDGRDGRQTLVTNNFGYGYTHKENGTLVAVTPGQSQAYVDNFDWGVKLYAGQFGDHTGTTIRNMTGIVVTFEIGVQYLPDAAPRTYP